MKFINYCTKRFNNLTKSYYYDHIYSNEFCVKVCGVKKKKTF